MALGLFTFLALITYFAVSQAAPLIHKSTSLTIQNPAVFQSQLEDITEIYRGDDYKVVSNIDHLVIVTGHAIILDPLNYVNDDAWILESFQRGGQIKTFVDHITTGVEIAKNDENSLLIFSGYILYYILKKTYR
jgi:hypothetical protein